MAGALPGRRAGPASARRSCAQSGTVAVASRSVTTFAHAVGAPGKVPSRVQPERTKHFFRACFFDVVVSAPNAAQP